VRQIGCVQQTVTTYGHVVLFIVLGTKIKDLSCSAKVITVLKQHKTYTRELHDTTNAHGPSRL